MIIHVSFRTSAEFAPAVGIANPFLRKVRYAKRLRDIRVTRPLCKVLVGPHLAHAAHAWTLIWVWDRLFVESAKRQPARYQVKIVPTEYLTHETSSGKKCYLPKLLLILNPSGQIVDDVVSQT